MKKRRRTGKLVYSTNPDRQRLIQLFESNRK